MPLPAVIAALARVAGPMLARVGARAAAGTVAEGAIGTAAQQAGKAAAGNAGGFVLDSTKLGNARQITAALGGKVPAAATGGATPATAATTEMPAAAPTPAPAPRPPATPRWRGPPKPPAPTVPSAASAPSPTVPGAASAPPSAPKATPPAPPPASRSPGGDTWGSQISKRFADIKTKVSKVASEAMQKQVPDVADQTKGMSWEQRYERLQKAGKLLEPSQVAKSIGTPNPTNQQITEKSEEHEQAANEKYNAAGQKAKESLKSAAFIGGVGGPIALALAFKKATDAATSYAEGQVEASRGLARFNAQIAGAVAKFDLADLKRNQRFTNATGGSTAQLLETFSKFKDDLQPIKQIMTTGFNVMAKVVIQFCQIAIAYMKTMPSYAIAKAIADEAERREKAKMGTIQGDFRSGINNFLATQNKKVGK